MYENIENIKELKKALNTLTDKIVKAYAWKTEDPVNHPYRWVEHEDMINDFTRIIEHADTIK